MAKRWQDLTSRQQAVALTRRHEAKLDVEHRRHRRETVGG